jgi:alpha-galactosidase
MMNTTQIKITGFRKKAIASLIILANISLATLAQQSTVKVDVRTVEKSIAAYTVNKVETKNQQVFNIQLNNSGNQTLHLNSVIVTITPEQLIPEGTTYVIGADEMLRREGNVVLTQTGKATRNNDNNMYLMFKNGENDFMLVGVISWRTFLCQIFTSDGVIHIKGDGDNKELKAGSKVPFEKVVYMRDNSWQNLLDRYADIIVKENNVPKPPKVNWKGWATWDFYVQYFLAEDVERNTKIIKDLNVNNNIIQIDGGWWPQRGDYFDVRENLLGGIKAIVEKIHKSGNKAGLHFDGFRVSIAAKIVKKHPEYFIHDDKGDLLVQGKDPVTKDYLVYWDFSHPGAQKYIEDVMKNARENWKVDYFKIDFMRNGLVIKGKSYLPVTNVERYRMGIMAMRRGIKDKYFLACSPNFGVNIGLIEASRTGPDIDPTYDAVKIRAQHNSGSYYFSKKIYNCDPDYLVLRCKEESNNRDGKKPTLTYEQGVMWTNFVSIFGNVRLESDELSLISEEKKMLLQKGFAMPFFERTIPIDFWDHYKTDSDAPNIYLAKGENGEICLGVFNWDTNDSSFEISGFTSPASFNEFSGPTSFKTSNNKLNIPLKGVMSVLLKYNGPQTFDQLRKQLKITASK